LQASKQARNQANRCVTRRCKRSPGQLEERAVAVQLLEICACACTCWGLAGIREVLRAIIRDVTSCNHLTK
jgi:hypothetical protein